MSSIAACLHVAVEPILRGCSASSCLQMLLTAVWWCAGVSKHKVFQQAQSVYEEIGEPLPSELSKLLLVNANPNRQDNTHGTVFHRLMKQASAHLPCTCELTIPKWHQSSGLHPSVKLLPASPLFTLATLIKHAWSMKPPSSCCKLPISKL